MITSTAPDGASSRRERRALGLIAVLTLPVGLQATFTPASFFNDFPLGRAWIAHDGDAYNEHLVRDVGVLFLALTIVTCWTAVRGRASRPVAVAWLVQGSLHLWYHAGHLGSFGTVDTVGLVASLVAIPGLALFVLWSGLFSGLVDRRGRTSRTESC